MANNKEGWIALYRQFQDHWLWTKHRIFSEAEAWIDIILQVQYSNEPQNLRIKNKILTVNRGESVKSLETWGNRWNWNKSKVRRFFDVLKIDTMIETTNETVTIRLKVLNYDNYQNVRHEKKTRTTRKGNDNETTSTPDNKETINISSKEEILKQLNNKYADFENLKNQYEDLFSIEDFLVTFNDWIKFRIEKGEPIKDTGLAYQFKKMRKLNKNEQIIEIIQNSIANGWQGLFELKQTNGNDNKKSIEKTVDEFFNKHNNKS